MDGEFRCEACARTFTLPAATLARYPGWRPKHCLSCRPDARKTRRGRSDGASGEDDGFYTDGACAGNPGPGGWAVASVVAGEVVEERAGGAIATTNNRMELRAVIEALRMAGGSEEAIVFSDSQLVVNTLTRWAAGWERRNWRKADGSDVANLDLVQEAFALLRECPGVRIEWLRGHAGARWNEYADALARSQVPGGGQQARNRRQR